MENVRFLIIGDPEGKVRYKSLRSITEKYLKKGDFIIFTGDCFSNQYTEYYRYKSKNFFPEKNMLRDLVKNYRIIIAYGNKDVKSKIFNCDKLRESIGIISVEDFYGEKVIDNIKLCFINGSNVANVPSSITSKKMIKEIRKILKYNNRKRLSDLSEEEIDKLRKKFGLAFKICFDYSYVTNYSWLENMKADADILITHTPPLLDENSEIVLGSFPDVAIYKETEEGIKPAKMKDTNKIIKHVGNVHIKRFCERSRIKLVVCGHIHEASGIALYRDKLILNPGSIASYTNDKKILPFILLETNLEFVKFKIILNNWDGLKEIWYEL